MRFISRTTDFKSNAFSLTELLVVIVMVAILTTLSIAGFSNVVRSSRLEQAARTVVDEINLARQIAATRNTDVEVRFIRKPRSSASDNVFWQIQSGTFERGTNNSNTFSGLKPATRLPQNTVFTVANNLSPILTRLPISTNEGDANSTYVSFTIRPNGEISPQTALPANNRSEWCTTIVSDRDQNRAIDDIDDFVTIQVDPITSRTKVYRP